MFKQNDAALVIEPDDAASCLFVRSFKSEGELLIGPRLIAAMAGGHIENRSTNAATKRPIELPVGNVEASPVRDGDGDAGFVCDAFFRTEAIENRSRIGGAVNVIKPRRRIGFGPFADRADDKDRANQHDGGGDKPPANSLAQHNTAADDCKKRAHPLDRDDIGDEKNRQRIHLRGIADGIRRAGNEGVAQGAQPQRLMRQDGHMTMLAPAMTIDNRAIQSKGAEA